MGMSVAFYYKDIHKITPPPDLSITEICGDILPDVVLKQQASQATVAPTRAPSGKISRPTVVSTKLPTIATRAPLRGGGGGAKMKKHTPQMK